MFIKVISEDDLLGSRISCWARRGNIHLALFLFIWNYQLKWHQLSAHRVSMTGSTWPRKCISLLSHLPSLSHHGISFSISDVVFVFLQRPSAMSKRWDMHWLRYPDVRNTFWSTWNDSCSGSLSFHQLQRTFWGSHSFETCPALEAFGLDRSLVQKSRQLVNHPATGNIRKVNLNFVCWKPIL